MRQYPPELNGNQAAGRAEWQKGLPPDTLMMIDLKANAAMQSEAHLDDYLAFTRQWRAALKEERNA